MLRGGYLIIAAIALVLGAVSAVFAWGWYGAGPLEEDTPFVVSSGSSLTAIASKLEEQGAVNSADGFLLRSKLFGGSDPVQAGEFLLPAGASANTILDAFQSGDVIRRFITIPEGMPSILVHEKLMAESLLTGEVTVPAEGSVLPDTYDFERSESRASVMKRMTEAMDKTLAEFWENRGPDIAVKTPQEAIILASIVEKETGIASERGMVAGLYSNRVKTGMMLQADPTIIYPITKGKPLGRRIRQSEISAINDYNTYSMVGMPKGPITNPGRESIAAVLNPDKTDAIFMVADGSGGHAFAVTLEQHNANVEKWFALRRQRGEM